jgi:CheY-specific phosphatase CheX
MAVKFFGQFLVEKGHITSAALLKAIALQESANLKFGEMALSMGLITSADIDRVHDAQRKEDLQFGDMCVKMGILSTKQLQEVLTKQKNSHLYIGEALVKVGAVCADDLSKYLEAFKVDQAPYMVDKVSIPAGVPDPSLWELAADLTYKMLTRVANLTVRQGKCLLVQRFEANDTVVAIQISGSARAWFMLSVSTDVRSAIARALLKSDDVSGESEDMLNDTVMEFANIVCGNFAAKAAQMGKTLEISPPEILNDIGIVPMHAGDKGLLFPVYIADGLIEFCLIVEAFSN